MRLFEIKAEPYPYTVTDRSSDGFKFLIVQFETRTGSTIKVMLSGEDNGEADISFTRDGNIKLSGGGDQFRILITVKSIIEKHLNQVIKNSVELFFSADSNESSRVKLYTNKVVPLINNLIGDEWTGPVINHADQVEFVWKRTDTSNPENGVN